MRSEPPLDISLALRRIDGDRELYRDLLRLFRQQTRRRMAALEAAAAGGDLPTCRRVAHSIKGTAATVAAGPVLRCASELEAAVRAEEPIEAPLAGLRARVAELESFLETSDLLE